MKSINGIICGLLLSSSLLYSQVDVDQKDYSKIEIIAATLIDCKTGECEEFLKFLQSPFSKAIFTKYGL